MKVQQSKARDPKVVLLGDSASGKTCLAVRYIHGEFIKQSETVGASIYTKDVTIGSKMFRIGLWDTAGSERFRSMMPMYYHGSDIALLCYDVNDSSAFERVSFWENELRQNEPTCSIFVVGTMLDLLPEANEPLLKEREETFANEQGIPKERFFRTSAVTGAGIDELFRAVSEFCAANIQDLKLYNPGTPASSDESEESDKKCCVVQ